jgi:hypothetical protein
MERYLMASDHIGRAAPGGKRSKSYGQWPRRKTERQ